MKFKSSETLFCIFDQHSKLRENKKRKRKFSHQVTARNSIGSQVFTPSCKQREHIGELLVLKLSQVIHASMEVEPSGVKENGSEQLVHWTLCEAIEKVPDLQY